MAEVSDAGGPELNAFSQRAAGIPGAGKTTFPTPVEIVPAMAGVTLYHQRVAVDFAAPASLSMNEGLAYMFCL
jgi:hypothetical protein